MMTAYLVAHIMSDPDKGEQRYDLASTINIENHTEDEIIEMGRTMGESFGRLLVRAKRGEL